MAKKKAVPRTVKKPLSIWDRPLKADFKGLFKALAEGAEKAVGQQWYGFASKAVDAISAVGFEDDPCGLAWVLIRRAMTRAVFDLSAEAADLLATGAMKVKSEESLLERLDRSLDEAEVRLDKSLFDRPAQLPIVGMVQSALREWLAAYGLDGAQVGSLAGRLPSYFVLALYEEWRKNAATYQPIKKALDDNPFTRADDREQQWRSYAARLRKEVDQRMFEEAFSLEEVYVPLRAHYEVRTDPVDPREDSPKAAGHGEKRIEQRVVDLEAAIDQWLEEDDPRDAIRLISGGPGSGKSSFCKRYAARRAFENGGHVVFIPLHLFDVQGSLEASVDEFCKRDDLLPGQVLDPKSGSVLNNLVEIGLYENPARWF